MQWFLRWGKTAWAWITNFQALLGFLSPSALAAVTLAIGFLSEVSPLLLWMCTGIAGVIGYLAWRDIKSQSLRVSATIGLALLSIGVIAQAVYQKHKNFNNYEVSVDGWDLQKMVTNGYGTDEPTVGAVKLKIWISNPNSFATYSQLIKHYSSINGRNSNALDEPSNEIKKIDPNGSTIADDDTIDVGALTAGKIYEGEVDFEIQYGRDPKKLNKRLSFRRRLLLQFCKPRMTVCQLDLY